MESRSTSPDTTVLYGAENKLLFFPLEKDTKTIFHLYLMFVIFLPGSHYRAYNVNFEM